MIALLGAIALLAYAVQGGLAERVYTTWHLANQWDRAISATMPLAAIFRAAVAWVPRQWPGSSGPGAPFLMAIWSYFGVAMLLFALYALALRHLARHPTPAPARAQRMLLIGSFGALFGLLLLFTPAAPSHDPLAYASAGRLLGTHGANPFFVVPSAYPRDTVLAANEWPVSTTAYGPLWALLSLALNPLVNGDPLRANLIYRVVAYLTELANIVLVAALARQLPPRFAAWRERGLLVYAWNPLVVIEVAAGHNDVVMLTLLLLGLYLIGRGRRYWGMASLGGAVLLKANALPLALVIALAGWLMARPAKPAREAPVWRGWARGLGPAGLALGVVAVGYLPFYWGHSLAAISAASSLQPTTQALARALTSSFGTLAGSGAVLALPTPLSATVVGAVLALANPLFWTVALGLALLATTFLLLPRLRQAEAMAPVLVWVYAAWMIFLCIFHLLRTWYLIPLVGLASLTPLGRSARRFVLALTVSLQLSVLFLSKSPPFNGWQPWTLALVLGIPVVALAVGARRRRWRWRAAATESLALLQARLALVSAPPALAPRHTAPAVAPKPIRGAQASRRGRRRRKR